MSKKEAQGSYYEQFCFFYGWNELYLQVSIVRKERDSLWLTNILLPFIIVVIKRNEDQEYAFQ